LKRIHKVIAICGSAALLTLTLTPAALAAGTRLSGSGARTIASLPTTDIKGSPAKFSPSTLSVKSRQTTSPCTKAQASFEMLNKKSTTEKVVFTSGGHTVLTVKVKAHAGEFICIPAGSSGTAVGKLTDGKKLTVHVS
jgi:hypothetical protein